MNVNGKTNKSQNCFCYEDGQWKIAHFSPFSMKSIMDKRKGKARYNQSNDKSETESWLKAQDIFHNPVQVVDEGIS